MENKCQKCFYYKLCVQHDYVIEEEKEITNNYCGIYENGIPSKTALEVLKLIDKYFKR